MARDLSSFSFEKGAEPMKRKYEREPIDEADLFQMFWDFWRLPYRQTRKDFLAIYSKGGEEAILRAIKVRR